MRLTGTVVRCSSHELALDRPGDRDQPVHVRRQLAQVLRSSCERIRLEWTVATRYGRRCPASPSAMTARVADDLGPVHVGVDHVGAHLGQMGRQRADGDRIVRLVDDEDRDAGLLQLAHGTPRRQRHDRHVVARGVEPRDQRVEVLLGAAVGAGREHLDDPDPPAGGQRRTHDGLEARIEGRRRAHAAPLRRTSSRWIGSSTRAPLVLVGLVAAQEVEPALARGDAPARRTRRPSRRRATGRARPDRRRRCSRGSRRPSRNGPRRRSAGRRPSGTSGEAARPGRSARTAAARTRGSARRRPCRGRARARPSASGAGR